MNASASVAPNGFGERTTAAEVIAGLDLSGTTAIVTGAASGIGVETARALAGAGASVTLAVRDVVTGARVADDIRRSNPGSEVTVSWLDLADLRSVDAFTHAWTAPLHTLVNNAGVMWVPEARTAEGWELHFATNHLGHFALATGLHYALVAGASSREGGARIVSVSSSGHASSPIVFDDLFFERRPYDAQVAYGQSKTANVLFAVEATRRWAHEGVTANALMPGGIWTNLQRHWDPAMLAATKRSVLEAGMSAKSPEQGAATSVYVATSRDLDGIGGRYFEDCQEAALVDSVTDGVHGVVAHALDPAAAERLWQVSLELLETGRGSA